MYWGCGCYDAGVVQVYSDTPAVTHLLLHAYTYTTTRVAMRVLCRYPLALIAEEYGYVPVNIALLVAVLKLFTLAY